MLNQAAYLKIQMYQRQIHHLKHFLQRVEPSKPLTNLKALLRYLSFLYRALLAQLNVLKKTEYHLIYQLETICLANINLPAQQTLYLVSLRGETSLRIQSIKQLESFLHEKNEFVAQFASGQLPKRLEGNFSLIQHYFRQEFHQCFKQIHDLGKDLNRAVGLLVNLEQAALT